MIRLFAAIEVPPDLAEELEVRQQGVPEARWRPREALHITLRFCGEVSEPMASDLDAELSRVGGQPFEVALERVGAFGEGEDIRAIWAGVADTPALNQLASRCETAARRAGLTPESRAFKPHVTLAYLKRPEPAKVAAWIQANNLLKTDPFRVTWFGLYSSWRSAEGSRYELEREYPLF